MQNNFREQVSRFTMARNYKDGSFVLITALEGEDFAAVELKGKAEDIITGLCAAIDLELNRLDTADAIAAREKIKQAIIKDEQRRFNAGADEEEQPCHTDPRNHVGIRVALG